MWEQKINLIPESNNYIKWLSSLEWPRKIIWINKWSPINHEHLKLIMEWTNLAVELIISERIQWRNWETMIISNELIIWNKAFKIPLKFYTQNISSEKIKQAS